jgi:hypothetical protein
MSEEFKGFPPPTKNFFSLPNEMVNIIAHITNLAELKVIIYVMRHTWGYHEYGISKAISVDEFMHGRKREDGSRMDQGTGLSNRSVIDGLRSAVQHGYLICDVDASDLARVKKSYALRMINRGELSSPHEDTSYSEGSSPRYEESSHGYEASSYLGEEPSHRSEKYTNRKTLKKDTLERQDIASPNVDAAPVTDLHKWKTDSEKRRALFADVPLSKEDEGEDISLLETRKHVATDPSQQKPDAGTRASVVNPPVDDQDDSASVQASSSGVGSVDAAQRTALPQGGAVQASIPKRPRSRKPLVLPLPAPEIPQEALQIMDAWDSLFKAPLARTDKHVKAAMALIPCHPSKDDLKDCKNWLFTTDNPQKPWFRKKGVSLQDIADNFGQWQSVQDVPPAQQNGNAKRDENIGVSGLPRLPRREVKYG